VLPFRQEKIDFWDNVYGFDMSSIKERALIEPLVDNVDPEQIATSSCQMKTIDILDMKVEDANFEVRADSWTDSEHAHLRIAFACRMIISDNLEMGDASSEVRTVSWTAAVLFTLCGTHM